MIFETFKLNNKLPIYKQLEEFIKDNFVKGNLHKGYKLPSTRELSKLLNISRNSVITAYDELVALGYIVTIKGKGSFISLNRKKFKTIKKNKINWPSLLNNYGKTCEELDILKTGYKWGKGMISFKSIAPDESLFDIEGLKQAFGDLISLEGKKILNYGYAKGYNKLREFLLLYMESKGIDLKDRDLLITNGFTEGFDLVISSMTDKNDIVLTEEPTHNTILKILKAHEIKTIGCPMDINGIIIDNLEDKLRKNKPKFVYLTPSYQNPTGIVMSADRRKDICSLLEKYSIPIIEDGFNEELLYSSSHLMPLAAYSLSNNNVYIGSLSKILFPGLRIGWIIADKDLIATLESVKRARTIHTSFLDQGILYYYLKNRNFSKYIKKIKKFYSDKFKMAVDCVNKYIPYEHMTGNGGLHLFIKLNKNISVKKVLKECNNRGVLFMPGNIFFIDMKEDSTFRLGFSRVTDNDIAKGIKIIGEVVKSVGE